MLRQHADAQAADHTLLDAFGTVEFDIGLHGQPLVGEQFLDGLARPGTAFTADESLLRNPCERNLLLSCQRVVGTGDDDEYVLQEGILDDRHAFRWLTHDVQVALVLREAREQAGTVGDLQPRLDLRIPAHEAAEQVRHEILAGTHDVNVQRTGHFTAQVIEGCFEVAQPLQNILRCLEDLLPGHRQVQFLADVLDERHAHLSLQALDLDGYRWLCEVHLFGGAGHALVLGDGSKKTELL